MCRLFALRSNVPEQVHRPLVLEPNSLRAQSFEHEDGWGIASWADGRFEVARGFEPAHRDPDFEAASSSVCARTVIAHVRRASVGAVGPGNSHPFVHEGFAFAHNGTLQDFERRRPAIEEMIVPELRARLRGETDSERCFLLFLGFLREHEGPGAPGIREVAVALARTVKALAALDTPDQPKPSSMNFLCTDGRLLAAIRSHRTLFMAPGPRPGSRLERFVVASEPIASEQGWLPVPEGGVVGVDPELALFSSSMAELAP